MTQNTKTIHASCVAYGNRGLLIIGPSGSGKSSLALSLMSLGASLVADDRTRLLVQDGVLIASCPDSIKGQIEARGVGILCANTKDTAVITQVADLGVAEQKRLPDQHKTEILGVELDTIFGKGNPVLPQALHLLMQSGRQA